MTNSRRAGAPDGRLAGQPARLHRRPACRRLRSRAPAGALESVPPAYDGVATIALDHPRVRAAIDDMADRGVAVVTLVSDVPSSRRLHYVGIDNPAAGRTAAALMGRFLRGRHGAVGVIAGSLALRDHAERQFGFPQVLSSEYPGARRPARRRRPRRQRAHPGRRPPPCWRAKPDLVGLYNVGAGNRGIAAALEGGRPRARHRLDRPRAHGTYAAASCCSGEDRRDHQPEPGPRSAFRRARPARLLLRRSRYARPGADQHRHLPARQPPLTTVLHHLRTLSSPSEMGHKGSPSVVIHGADLDAVPSERIRAGRPGNLRPGGAISTLPERLALFRQRSMS